MKNLLIDNLENQKPALTARDIHLWLVDCDAIREPGLLLRYQQLLTPQERQKQQRFLFERHRKQYLLTRALVRTTLSRYENITPEKWVFTSNDYGRPEIASSLAHKLDHDLRFNLSHTDGLIVCALCNGRAIGVDVEHTGRCNKTTDIAERFFSAEECAALRALPKASQHARFFDYWTLKESYIKARGMGLAIPLAQFSFHLSANKPIRISFSAQIDDDPAAWSFRLFTPDSLHKLALCVSNLMAFRRDETLTDDLRIRAWSAVPLVDARPIALC